MAGTKAPRRKVKAKDNGQVPELPAAVEVPDAPVLAPIEVLGLHTHGESESSRYCLGAIKIEHHDGRPYAIASDGRRMAILSWNPSEGSAGEFLVPMGTAKIAAETITHKRSWKDKTELRPTGVKIEAARGGAVQANEEPLDGRFPQWWTCVPKLDGYKTVTINAQFLRDAATLLESLGDYGITLSIKDRESPVVLSARNGETNGCVVIMPLNTTDHVEPKPWLPPVSGKEHG